MEKTFKIFVIHHSHTDIGYTDMQSVIQDNHFDYIRQAINIIEEDNSFLWTLENFWQVENFSNSASETEYVKFIKYIKTGNIIITANYLNMTDLIDYEIYNKKIKEFSDFANLIKVTSQSALTCDVNGYKKDYMRALLNNGINNLMTSVHPHHGVAPTFKVNNPYYIEVDSKRLLVWNNQHYLYGNDLGIVPKTLFSYTIKDEFNEPLGTYNNDEELRISTTRIKRFIKSLREDETYKYDFVPILVSGQRIDNAAPNKDIISRIKDLNLQLEDDSIQLEFASLDDIFQKIKLDKTIPVYKGEFPDFWVDGIISTPKVTKLFLQVQRDYIDFIKFSNTDKYHVELSKIEQLLLLYGEHTWGHSDSVKNPYNDFVYNIQVIKENYVYQAYKLLTEITEDYKHCYLGASYNNANRVLDYQLINNNDYDIEDIYSLKMDHFERTQFSQGIKVIDTLGKNIELDIDFTKDVKRVDIYTNIPANTSIELKIVSGKIEELKKDTLNKGVFENNWIKIDLNEMSMYHKETKTYLTTGEHFGITHQISDVVGKPVLKRGFLGLNKMFEDTLNNYGIIIGVSKKMESDISSEIEVTYDMDTLEELIVTYKVFKNIERIDIDVQFLKKATFNIENIFFELSFVNQEIKLLNKFEEVVPWVDQIEGSLIDYYYIDQGVKFESIDLNIFVITKDNPIVYMRELKHHENSVKIGNLDLEKRHVSSWIMNNIWETNFNLDLGGFYNFGYSIIISDKNNENVTPYKTLQKAIIIRK